MLVLGIDIGTTNTKAVLMSGDKPEVVAASAASYAMRYLGDGGVEQDPLDWWRAVCDVIASFGRQGYPLDRIEAIAVSGHGCSLVAVDEAGEVLRPAISSLDTRCSPQTAAIRQSAGDRILEINGNSVGAFNFEPKLLWLKENEPSVYERMPCFLSPASYINYRLTGRKAMNVSDGGIGMAYDRRSGGQWSSAIIGSMGLDAEKFPPLAACGEPIGRVTRRAAQETGLPEHAVVLGGGEDTSSAALSMGVVSPRQAYLSLGTQGTVGVCTDRFAVRPEILGFPHVLEGRSLLSGSMSTCGGGMQWLIREWYRDYSERFSSDGEVLQAVMEDCRRTNPGAGGLLFLPYLSGELHPILDEKAAGVFFGLKLHHTRQDMARSVMEGAAHAIAHNLKYAEMVAGEVEELNAVGGPTRSELWCQAIADITGKPVRVAGTADSSAGAPLGNAMLALAALTGQRAEDLAAPLLLGGRTYEPREAVRPMYKEQHAIYLKLYPRLKDLYALLPS